MVQLAAIMAGLAGGLIEQGNSPLWGALDRRAQWSLLLALVVAISNPLACLVHCWTHVHPVTLTFASVQVAQHVHHAAHDTGRTAPVGIPQPDKSQTPADETFCRSGHLAPSPLTIAVLTVLLPVTFSFIPTFALQAQPLFGRLPDHPPPRRPPRF